MMVSIISFSRLPLLFVIIAALFTSSETFAQKQKRSGDFPAPVIAFVTTRDTPDTKNSSERFLAMEIYLSDLDGKSPRRLTDNKTFDGYPNLSPDGKRIVFDSGRLRKPGDPDNLSELFLMDSDGANQVHLLRGSSATWSPDGKHIAYHASASGKGTLNRTNPGSATSDSDIFILNIDEFLKGKAGPRNLTNSPQTIDEDADWSPDGKTILYTRYGVNESHANTTTAEVYKIRADGKGTPQQLTRNSHDDRGPAWSPDGKRIVHMCKTDGKEFGVCVMNADGSGQTPLTGIAGRGTSWSPDSGKIIFHRDIQDEDGVQLFSVDADGNNEKQLTIGPGLNGYPNPGFVRKKTIK